MKAKLNKLYSPQKLFYVGNDIVCLTSAYNIRSFSNEKYIAKILNQKELNYCIHSDYKLIIPPLLWSCKESIYKILLKKGLKNVFLPKKIKIDIDKMEMVKKNNSFTAENQGFFENNTFYCHSVIEQKFIHTFSCVNKESLNNCVVSALEWQNLTAENQSETTYNFLLRKISEHFSLDISFLKIIKDNNGLPSLYFNNILLNIPFSVSHDDNFISFAFLKM